MRSTGELPWSWQVPEANLPSAIAEAAAEFDAEDGTLAVIVPFSRLEEVTAVVRAIVPSASIDGDLTNGAVVITPEGSKGLEFDSVLVADPVGIITEGVRGHNDLYVALTRATQRLGVVHAGELPPELKGLDPR